MSGNDQEHWRRVDGILEAALELPVPERDALLERACGGDPVLRREVDSLIAHDRADSFLAGPGATEVAQLLVDAVPPPLVGQRIGSFEVLAGIGAGGMGEVYLAQDTRLQRRVALKRIPAHLATDPERVRRFRREALATSALNHPNIVTVYEIVEHQGGDLLITELVDGVSLREGLRQGPLPLAKALDIAVQIARGLAAAHELGIVHRDVKPENVMVRRDGLVKVLDFGVAISPPPPLAGPGGATSPGDLIGTLGYMSPEQARGLPVDARTDVWSLGVILYELLTGESPFPGATPTDRLAAIVEREPEPPSRHRRDLPVALDGVIARALAKDAGNRYADGARLAAALEGVRSAVVGGRAPLVQWLGAARWRAGIAAAVALAVLIALWLAFDSSNSAPGFGPAKLPRLAVLPFEDLGAPEDSYFAAGITEELISGLATVRGLEVISRTTATRYSGAGKQLREIGRDLGVDYVLEGTVRWDLSRPGHARVRVTPQLIRVSDDTHLWAGTYDRDLADVFAVQADIGRQVVDALGVTLSERERRLVGVPPTRNREAYQLYLRGLRAIAMPTGDLVAGAELMHRAAELDPDFVLAHVREAKALAYSHFLGGPLEHLQRARVALARAQTLAPEDPFVRLASGMLHYHGERAYARALVELQAAAQGMPSNGEVPQAMGAVLRRLGRFEEALASFIRARDLGSPEGSEAFGFEDDIAATQWFLRRYPDVDRYYERRLRLTPEQAWLWAARAQLQLEWKGDTAAARAALAGAPESVEPELTEIRVWIDLCDRRFEEAIARAQPRLDLSAPRAPLGVLAIYAFWRMDRLAEVTDFAHRFIAAVEERRASNPDSRGPRYGLAMTHALLGSREPALASARTAVELMAGDAIWGPHAVEVLARVHTLLGDHDEALALLPELLVKSYEQPLNANRLRLEPWWDPLRGDPRFERLLTGADPGEAP